MKFPIYGKSFKIPWFQSPPTSIPIGKKGFKSWVAGHELYRSPWSPHSIRITMKTNTFSTFHHISHGFLMVFPIFLPLQKPSPQPPCREPPEAPLLGHLQAVAMQLPQHRRARDRQRQNHLASDGDDDGSSVGPVFFFEGKMRKLEKSWYDVYIYIYVYTYICIYGMEFGHILNNCKIL